MAENAKDSDERGLRGGRGCAPVRLVDQERRAELDRQGNGRSFTGIQFLGILGYAISVQGSPNLEERQSGDIDAFEWPARDKRGHPEGTGSNRLNLVNYFADNVPSTDMPFAPPRIAQAASPFGS